MNVLILATKGCSHRTILEKGLQDLGVNYQVKYVEDDPEAMKKYQIRNSPNLIVNGNLVFRALPMKSLPSDEELKNYVNQ
jgi:glutaredoxin